MTSDLEAQALVERLGKLLSRATPGPMVVIQNTIIGSVAAVPFDLEISEWYDSHQNHGPDYRFVAETATETADGCFNAALIVEAINALPTLLSALTTALDRVRVLEEERDMAQREVAAWTRGVLNTLSDCERSVLPHMGDGEYVPPISETATAAGLAINEVRKAFRELRAKKMAEHGPLVDLDSSAPKGSGTWLTRFGFFVSDALSQGRG